MSEPYYPLGPVNVAEFQRVKQHILEEPRRFNMAEWGKFLEDKDRDWFGDKFPPCGTVACIAGWTNVLNQDSLEDLDCFSFGDDVRAARLLGIDGKLEAGDVRVDPEFQNGYYTRYRRRYVFFVEYWAKPWRTRYEQAKTPQERVEVAASYIDWLCGLSPAAEERTR